MDCERDFGSRCGSGVSGRPLTTLILVLLNGPEIRDGVGTAAKLGPDGEGDLWEYQAITDQAKAELIGERFCARCAKYRLSPSSQRGTRIPSLLNFSLLSTE